MRLLVLACVFIGGIGQGVVNPKLPEILASPENLALDSGISASLMYVAIFLASFWYGSVADRGGTFRLLRLGLLSYAGILYLFSRAHSVEFVYLLRFLEGLGLSAVYVAADVVLCRASKDEERGQWLSYYGIALSLGLLFGPALLLIGEALHLFSALNTSLWIIAASAVLMAAVCGRQNLPVLQSSGEQPKLNKYASVSAALYGFLEAGLVAVLAATVLKSFHAKVETVFITIILSAALASAGWGYLIDRWGGRKTLLALHFVLAVSLGAAALIMTFWPGERMIFISSIFFGVVAGGLYPAAFSWLAEKIHPSHLGFASGHFTRAYGFGSLLGPLCFGFAVEWYGATGLFGISAVLGAIGFGVTAVSKS